MAGWWQKSLPSLAKELARETDSRDDKVSTQVRLERKEKLPIEMDREPYHSVVNTDNIAVVLINCIVLKYGKLF
jgi:hypothetical protein